MRQFLTEDVVRDMAENPEFRNAFRKFNVIKMVKEGFKSLNILCKKRKGRCKCKRNVQGVNTEFID